MALGLGLLFFFGPIFFRGEGFYSGDYREQFYPWASYLHGSIRHLSLPLWAPEMGAGFPLLAEGQIGALHPIQGLLFFLLPFPLAYHTGFIFYFALTALGVYFLAIQLRVSPEGATLAALTFLFSNSSSGMAYGLASLRTFCVFPWCLYFIGRLFNGTDRWRRSACLALSLGLFFLGGYMPWGPYLFLACAGYFFYLLKSRSTLEKKRVSVYFMGAWVAGLGLAAAQILPTLELLGFTARSQAPLEFALQKSLNPFSLATFFYPGFSTFLGFDFYLGVLPFCFSVLALGAWKADGRVKFLTGGAAILFFIALGEHNRFFVTILKMTHFYFLRGPAKAMFLVSFILALLTGIGWDRFITLRKFSWLIKSVFVTAFGLLVAAFIAPRYFSAEIVSLAEQYVRSHIVGKFGHIHTSNIYFERIGGALEFLVERTSFSTGNTILWVPGATWFFALAFFLCQHTDQRRSRLFTLAILLITLDLFLYHGVSSPTNYTARGGLPVLGGFRAAAAPAETVEADSVIQRIREEKGLFRIFEYRSPDFQAPGFPIEPPRWFPNTNLLFGISSAGIYSPLVIDAYREALKTVGGVDNSTGTIPTSQKSWTENKRILDLLNVRFVLAYKKESLDGVDGFRRLLESKKNGDVLYENRSALSRALVGDPERVDQAREAEVREYTPQRVTVNAEADEGDMLILSDVWYPGWKAFVDGRSAPIQRILGAFRGVKLSSGKHEIRFVYEPSSFYVGAWVSFLSLLGCGACLFSKK